MVTTWSAAHTHKHPGTQTMQSKDAHSNRLGAQHHNNVVIAALESVTSSLGESSHEA